VENMRIKLSINPISGISGLVLYLALSAVSFSFYPSFFSPIGNWLSDLGNNLLNPEGAIFYRLAGILSGAVLLVFGDGKRGTLVLKQLDK
jgi:hypothetical membrane protein